MENDDELKKSLSEITVREVMSKKLISACPETTVYQISKLMEQGIGAILVKRDENPEGIITDRDFAIKIAANKLSFDETVDKVASFPLKTISPNGFLEIIHNKQEIRHIL